MIVRGRWTLLPSGIEPDVVVEVEGRTITAVRRPERGDPPAEDGLLVPGLVNAHLHLELSWAAGLVPGGGGFPAWAGRLMALPRPEPAHDPSPLVDAGTAVVSDVSNRGDTAVALAEAGLAGVVHHELLGFGLAALPDRLAAASAPDRRVGPLVVRPSPHATYSTPPALLVAASRPSAAPATVHLAEDPAELAFTRSGEGPFAELLDRLGVDWRWWPAPGCSPVAWLDRLGLLGPDLLLVHAVHVDDDDRARMAARRAPVCLCPRSNLHVGGALPRVPELLEAGIRLALGTDSLASSPSLDVLGEIPPLAAAFPQVPVERWLRMATEDGADALRASGFGRIEVGAAPGLVLLGVADPRELLEAPPPREWRVRGSGGVARAG